MNQNRSLISNHTNESCNRNNFENLNESWFLIIQNITNDFIKGDVFRNER